MGGGLRASRVPAVAIAVLLASEVLADDKVRCQPPAIGTATVQTTLDGRTLRLTDGREVRLAGIEVPGQGGAKAALATLVEGREVTLRRLGAGPDRHGRILADVRLPGGEQSVQQTLLAQGHARLAGRVGDTACAAEWAAAERAARAAGLGLWADPHYVMQAAGKPDQILADRGVFAVVQGKVLSVRESGGTIYVNFGRRWSEDFTVTVLKRNERIFSAAGLDLRNLAGRHVRVRGFVEERGGPWIEALRPEQIELVERD
jgi:endonuclease YncB( thermonuclease family)